MTKRIPGLFERWIEIERGSGRSMTDILADLNTAAGTRYKHNWPSVVASRDYELERCPVEVRRYMMHKVLAVEMKDRGCELPETDVDLLVKSLT